MRRRRRHLVTALLAAVALPGGAAALGDRPMASRYIVTLKDDAAPAGTDRTAAARSIADDLAKRHGGSVALVYGSALFGFAGDFTPAQAKAIAGDPRVKAVEPDQPVKAMPK